VHATALVPILSGDNIPPGIRRVGAAVNSTVRQASTANVAVIDTGIDLAHADLNAAAGKDCTGSGSASDGNGHGTHVAGTIGARNNGSGAVGVAPGTKLFSVRVLGSNGSGLTSQVICGIDWVTATRSDDDPGNDIGVANMSLGSGGSPNTNCGRDVGDAMHIAICNSVAAGVTYVVAAGNSGGDEQSFTPANYPEVITVTAVGDSDGLPGGVGGALSCTGGGDDTPASFSNFATRAVDIAHTIAAPGVCIRSTYPGGYATMSGTSMASPHVAGLVALCLGDGATPGPCAGKTPDEVRTIVRQAAADQSAVSPAGGFAGDPTRPTAGRYYGYLGSTRFPGTAPPVLTAPANTVAPAVTGAALVGTTLASTTGTWTGSEPIAYARQWMRCTTTATTSCTAIAGATGASYVLATADAARNLRVRVTASNAKAAVVALSEPTAVVTVPVVAPANTVKPVVSGSPVAGETLSSSTGTWTGTAPIA
jgi:subtilisin family serine protease